MSQRLEVELYRKMEEDVPHENMLKVMRDFLHGLHKDRKCAILVSTLVLCPTLMLPSAMRYQHPRSSIKSKARRATRCYEIF